MLIVPLSDEHVWPICSDGWSGSEGTAVSSTFHPLYMAYVSFNYPKPFCAKS